MRWASPVLTFRRTTTRPVELPGRELPAGEKVVLFYHSGNRDEQRLRGPVALRHRPRSQPPSGLRRRRPALLPGRVARAHSAALDLRRADAGDARHRSRGSPSCCAALSCTASSGWSARSARARSHAPCGTRTRPTGLKPGALPDELTGPAARQSRRWPAARGAAAARLGAMPRSPADTPGGRASCGVGTAPFRVSRDGVGTSGRRAARSRRTRPR